MANPDIAKLKSILGSGVLKVRLADGKETTFADINDLKARIAFLEEEDKGPTARAATRTTYATFSGRN